MDLKRGLGRGVKKGVQDVLFMYLYIKIDRTCATVS